MPFFEAPYPAYDPTDKSGYETVVKRWPIILTNVVDFVHRANHELTMNPTSESEEMIKEGKGIIERIGKLKYEMTRDRPLLEIEADGEASVDIYNAELKELQVGNRNTWFTAPWLFAECYLYRLLRSWFTQTTHWAQMDPFFRSKEDTFKGSSEAIYSLANSLHELQAQKADLDAEPEKIGILFQEMIQMSLWGNATDLSLLTNLTYEDIRKLQSVGKEAREERREFILHDDSQAVWEHLRTLKDARVDFVLDNAGFEVYTDLVFADFLVTYTSFVSKVVFHPKTIPWFVSDVTPPDFEATFSSLLSSDFFPESNPAHDNIIHMVTRWKSYVQSGVFSLSVPVESKLGCSDPVIDFWTTPYPYWDMKIRAVELFENLSRSGLVIFKGDLNFRKLTGDIRWPVSTPFKTAIGPLAGTFPILSLRTNKADVVVGVDQAKADELDAKGEKWRVNGRYALISFLSRDV